ncbi:PREDICTED: uncharacterized protein LOC104810704 [Tarenaya hassleriana]|uniref:uncharacterized protein LOC104810704 n=1 Tax=Tarenaya hassleriana TaxID=28532 RepID=UPI00053C3376|nr:PREDICTED: uncharacterized protein LOC104810704 [Tarenaya hassleriana]
MAAGGEEPANLRNSSGERSITRRNLLVSEKVEVRSVEEGFLGSWHPGTVVAAEKQYHRVKYDHLLYDDGTHRLMDILDVPESVEGLSCSRTNSYDIYRGRIRPVPPKLKIDEWNLPYGQCVDVFSRGVWWEGVLFDHGDGNEDRRVFLPDLGDEMNVDLSSLRLTLDWDAFRGTWKPRGTWLFLELIEKYEEENYLPVSVKQLWYDVQDRLGFERIREWTCSTRRLWESLVLKVIDDNLRITMNQFLDEFEHTSKLANDPNKRLRLDIFTSYEESTQVSTPQERKISCLTKLERQRHHALSALTCVPDRESDICDGEVSCSKSITANRNIRHPKQCGNWQHFDCAAELCPQAVSDYIRKPSLNTAINVRKHLKYTGWITEHLTDEAGRHRFRYISPDGTQTEHSLRQLCLHLIKCDEASTPPVTVKPPSLPYDKLMHKTQNTGQGYVLALPASQSRVTHDGGKKLSVETVLKYQTPRKYKDIKRESCNICASKAASASKKDVDAKMKPKMECRSFRRLKKKWKRDHTNLKYNSNQKRAISSLQNSKQNMRRGKKSSMPVEPRNCTISRRGKTRVLRSSQRVQQVITPRSMHQSPHSILSWLINNNVVLPRANIRCHQNIDMSLIKQGKITCEGIKCNCCRKIFTVSSFEVHAGGTSWRPAANIFLDDGRSLLDCQVEAYKMRKKARTRNVLKRKWCPGQNNNICSVCHYGGELILCDRCPSSYHAICLGLQNVPDGDWFCPSCCCGGCGQIDLKDTGKYTKAGQPISCKQCELKYHVCCLPNHDAKNSLETVIESNWFCSKDCATMFTNLEELTGKPREVGVENLTWKLMKSLESDVYGLGASDIETVAENHCKLSVALDVMHELFEPVKDPRSQGDLAEDVIFSRGNFRGFYTVVLERNDELVTVANVRIFGKRIAEIPLIGTRVQHRQLGMCRTLMNELEKVLTSLGVERLVLPAVPSMLKTWTNSFGFSKMSECERKNFLQFTFLEFGGTVMCHKLLSKSSFADPIPNTASLSEPLCDGMRRQNRLASDEISEVLQEEQHVEESSMTKESPEEVETHEESLVGDNRFWKYCYRRRKG